MIYRVYTSFAALVVYRHLLFSQTRNFRLQDQDCGMICACPAFLRNGRQFHGLSRWKFQDTAHIVTSLGLASLSESTFTITLRVNSLDDLHAIFLDRRSQHFLDTWQVGPSCIVALPKCSLKNTCMHACSMSTYLGYSPRLYAAISVPHHPEISVSKRLMIYERCVVRNELCRLKYVVEPWELEH
jgi:hypothetical protein